MNERRRRHTRPLLGRWRLAEVLAEGVRNTVSTPVRSGLMVLMVAALTVGAALADATTLSGLRALERTAFQEGSHVRLARAEAGLDARACRQLNDSSAVLASAALTRESEAVVIKNLGASISASRASPEVLDILALLVPGADIPPASSVLMSQETADATGALAGATLLLGARGPRTIDAVVSMGVLTREHGSGVVTLDTTATVAQTCLVVAQPGLTAPVEDALLPLVRPAGTTDFQVLALTGEAQRADDLVRRVEVRPTRHAPAAAGGAVLLIWMTSLLARRAEAGLYRSLTMRPSQIAAARTVEFAVLSAVGVVIAVPVLVVGILLSTGDADLAAWSFARSVAIVVGTGVSGSVVLGVLTARGSGLELVKD